MAVLAGKEDTQPTATLPQLSEEPTQTTNASQPENLTCNIKITNFTRSAWGTPVGVAASAGFNVTLQNLENRNIDNLTLEITVLDGNGNKIEAEIHFWGPGSIGSTAQMEPFDGILHANENRTIKGGILSDLRSVMESPQPLTFVVDLKLGNQTVDQKTFP
ncbi:MAG: hypothetical protein ACQCN3_07835 [Candidatus Bathyarchaeia archaeon]|jgi:hypothetical protein